MNEPRICWVPPCTASLGQEAIELCASVGLGFDDWQNLVLTKSLGLRPDGKWAAFEVGVNAARQNGKNEIALGRELVGLFLLNERLIIHSAHEFKTSTEHQRRIEEVIQNTPDLHSKVKPRGYKHSHGEESIELRNGQRIRFMTRTKGGGRGHTGDLVVFDEAMILAAMMLGALMPTLSARSVEGSPQLWYFGTAVDRMINENGEVFSRIRDRGIAGGDPSLAYFEWSVDDTQWTKDGSAAGPDHVPKEIAVDPVAWAAANPALNIRISQEHVANEQRSMDARTFAVERLGIGDWPRPAEEETAIDLDLWDELADALSSAKDPVCFAFDVTPMRSWASIAVAGYRSDGLPHVEVIEHREGTDWVAARLAALTAKHKTGGVALAKGGLAESLLPDIEKLRVKEPHVISTPDHAAACGRIYDAVQQRALHHMGLNSPHGAALDAAVANAVQKTFGDAWLWDRRQSSIDISPLVAATLALYELSTSVKPRSKPMVAFA